ncbi:MAG: hypothetical protein II393_03115, partial [Cytophagales bacterium]|nr:hypothetical protein [Cytophagales bacterium]
FYSMFYMTTSYLEQDIEQPDASGFIGLEKLDLSSAQNLAMMFYEALYKQKTINSLKDWILKNGADISQMFYVDSSKFLCQNGPDFSVLGGWIKRKDVFLVCSSGSKYEVFFERKDDDKNNDKLPDWYENRIEVKVRNG